MLPSFPAMTSAAGFLFGFRQGGQGEEFAAAGGDHVFIDEPGEEPGDIGIRIPADMRGQQCAQDIVSAVAILALFFLGACFLGFHFGLELGEFFVGRGFYPRILFFESFAFFDHGRIMHKSFEVVKNQRLKLGRQSTILRGVAIPEISKGAF